MNTSPSHFHLQNIMPNAFELSKFIKKKKTVITSEYFGCELNFKLYKNIELHFLYILLEIAAKSFQIILCLQTKNKKH